MKLTFLYQPVRDLESAVAFYRDTLGLEESWREGTTTAAFKLPGTEIELMLDIATEDGAERQAGGFFAVDGVESFLSGHPELKALSVIDMPGGRAATFVDPAGNPVRVFDQSTAEAQ